MTIPAADRWGLFAADLDPAERLARLRSMRAIVHLATGHRGDTLARELHLAERDATRLPAAVAALDRLAALDRRHVLASFARLYREPRGEPPVPHAAPARTTTQPPTVASVLSLLAAIEQRDEADPAAVAFRAALARKGREADAAGGPEAVAALARAVAADDPERADRRRAVLDVA